MIKNKRILLIVLLLPVFFISGWFINATLAGNDDVYYKIDKGLFYLKEVFDTVSRNYVDKLDPEALSKSAINGMIRELDPYTVFFEDPGSQRLGIITRGKYGGLGMEIGKQNGNITVISPIDDTPAKRSGIRAGDIIEKIDDTPTRTLSLDEASQRLRGKIGTEVTLVIKRPGLEKELTFTLTREEIVLKDVNYADFVAPGTALFRLSSFSEKSGKELKQAIRKLQSREKIERVILDLRGNPGGLLSSAVEVANVFLPQGKLIVSTHGVHEKETKFYTREKPLLPTQPLVVLVNRGSASASEIVSGALQDLDRAVIVGTPTFGKGLVQKVYPIDKITQAYLKITTAKYYTPSGRSIQKEDYKKNDKIFVDLSDSVEYNKKVNYYTKNGRVVHGGGGIKPDVILPEKKYDYFVQALWSRGFFFRFSVDYLSRHPEIKSQKNFQVGDSLMQKFRTFLAAKHFDFDLEGEKELKKFMKIAETRKYDQDIQDLVQVAMQKLDAEKTEEFNQWRNVIQQSLEMEFAEKLGGNKARLKVLFSHDDQIKKALELLNNQPGYQEILAVKK